MDAECALCHALDDAKQLGGPTETFNTPLLSTSHFTVLPSIGPLSTGHVMVVSKTHWPNLATMGVEAIREYEQLVSWVATKYPYSDGFLEAESGSTSDQAAGTCVIHTHMHWIPGFENALDVFDGSLEEVGGVNLLRDLRGTRHPYVFLRNRRASRYFNATGLRSQGIRRALFERIGRDDWDWAVAPRYDTIRQTVSLWQGYNDDRLT